MNCRKVILIVGVAYTYPSSSNMAQKGFEYEKNAYAALSLYDVTHGKVAGASGKKSDILLKSGTKIAGCELKTSPTVGGSLVMKYHDGFWDYGAHKNQQEKLFLQSIGNKYNVLREMNEYGHAGTNWRTKEPYLQYNSRGKKIYKDGVDPATGYEYDIDAFGKHNEIHIHIPTSVIADYYLMKNCSYINVGSHGFFTLNGKDELGLNEKLREYKFWDIPDFSKSFCSFIRIRCQYKSKRSYQFAMTLEFRVPQKSPYNIAPIKKNTVADIDQEKLYNNTLLNIF